MGFGKAPIYPLSELAAAILGEKADMILFRRKRKFKKIAFIG